MKAFVDEDEFSWVVIDEPLPPAFILNLANELFALARPFGVGQIMAERMKTVDLTTVLHEAVRTARHPLKGSKNPDAVQYLFDHIAGCRVQVRVLIDGLPSAHNRKALRQYSDLPLVESNTFDQMYGAGSLEAAVKLALIP